VLLDTAVYIQSFVMNVFGALDILAWIWVSEKTLEIGRRDIGLGPKCASVCASLSQETRDYLAGLEGVHWVEPKLVVEITYLTWTADNLLRHTVHVGLREDKPATDVRNEAARG
jgi:ATP-dependent DNA ligase